MELDAGQLHANDSAQLSRLFLLHHTYLHTIIDLIVYLHIYQEKKTFAMSASSEKKKRVERKNRLDEIKKPRGFERGLQIDEIVGATDYTGDLLYLIRWRDCTELDLLPSIEVNEKSPQDVIQFNEKRCPLKKIVDNNTLADIPIIVVPQKASQVVEAAEESTQKLESTEQN